MDRQRIPLYIANIATARALARIDELLAAPEWADYEFEIVLAPVTSLDINSYAGGTLLANIQRIIEEEPP